MRAVIIDDENQSREVLKKILSKYANNVEVVCEADGVKTGVTCITENQPDVVFLDIEMRDGLGFDLLDKLETIDFHLVFTTAYDQYALRAIKSSAVEYLLKPLEIDEVVATVDKLKALSKQSDISNRLAVLKEQLDPEMVQNRRMAIPVQDGLEFYKINNITYCEADRGYTTLVFEDKSRVISSKNLKEFEELLEDSHFARVHHKFLINLLHIQKYHKGEGGYVVMNNGDKVDVSRRKKDELMSKLRLS